MRVMVISLLIIGFCLGLGLYSYEYLVTSTNQMLEQTSQLNRLIEAEDWPQATSQLNKIHHRWKKEQKIWSLLINHQEIDNVELTLARLQRYIQDRNKVESLVENSVLQHWIEHIPEKEAVSLSNIF